MLRKSPFDEHTRAEQSGYPLALDYHEAVRLMAKQLRSGIIGERTGPSASWRKPEIQAQKGGGKRWLR